MDHIEMRFEAMVKAIEALNSVCEGVSKRLGSLETTVNDQIIGTLKRRLDEEMYEEFSASHGPKFEPVMADLKVINGDDYDPIKTLWEDVKENRSEEGFNEDEFIESTVNGIAEKLAKLKGVAEEAKAEAESPAEVAEIENLEEKAEEIVEAVEEGKLDEESAEDALDNIEDSLEEYQKDLDKGEGGRRFWEE